MALFRFFWYTGIIGICLTHSSLANSPVDSPLVQPVAVQPLNTLCSRNEDCPENHYCGGRSKKRCIECVDCAGHFRLPKTKSYDGQSCATHHSECGGCKEGYEELGGGVCKYIEGHSTVTRPISGSENENKEEEDDAQEASSSWLVSMILVGVFAVMLSCMLITKKVYNRKRTRNGNEEEAGLTALNGPATNSPMAFNGPTAPLPEEYSTPTPYYYESNNGGRIAPPEKIHQLPIMAQPFDEGNGASNWTIVADDGGDNPANIPDTVDGVAASSPPPQNNNVNNNGQVSGPGNGNAVNNRPQLHGEMDLRNNQRPHNDEPDNQIIARGPQNPNPYQERDPAPLGRAEGDQGDQVHMQVQIGFFGFVNVAFPRPPHHQAPPNEPLGRLVASAPPSPRQIDDTAVNLMDLSGTFLSDESFDSGTGTNEHDRSVPSRSASGGLSEMDVDPMYNDTGDSLYDDE